MLIKKGALRVYLLSEEGKEVTLYREYQGDICVLSASCILDQITFDVHIDAVSDSYIYKTSANIFDKLCKENIYVDNFTNKKVIDRFSDVMWAMQQILFMSMDKRLAIFLWDEIASQSAQERPKLHYTHEQIAKYTGSAREVISRMLKYFSDEGIVTVSRGDITIINKPKLRSIIA